MSHTLQKVERDEKATLRSDDDAKCRSRQRNRFLIEHTNQSLSHSSRKSWCVLIVTC